MDAYDILDSPEMKELMNEAKWLMLLGMISGNEADRPIYEFLKVFYDHGVEADVVVEALEKIRVLSSKKEAAVSASDLESFIKVLDDIQKKKGES